MADRYRGTNHFVSLSAASRYYRDYGFLMKDVERKIKEGEIVIGPPSGDSNFVIRGGRYFMKGS